MLGAVFSSTRRRILTLFMFFRVRSRSGVGPELAAVVTSCTAELAQARISAAGIAAPNVVITVDQSLEASRTRRDSY